MLKICYLLFTLFAFLATIEAQINTEFVLLEDNYNSLNRGPLSSSVGAHTEYHYLPETAPKGNWSVSNDRGWWSVREKDNIKFIYQCKIDKAKNTRPMIIAGDQFWNDYEIEAYFEPESTEYQSGIVFRYQNDLCYYFF
jgi:rhamnogalacturonan endolyase